MNAETFNARYPIGTPVFAYPGARPENDANDERLVTRTRTEAQNSASGNPVVWVDGEGSYICLTHVDPVSESVWQAAKQAEETAAAKAPSSGPRHATRAETIPALLTTVRELRDSRQPLIDALNLVHQSMTSCVGDEWAMEWLGEVWTRLPLDVRALAGDTDAAAELAANRAEATS